MIQPRRVVTNFCDKLAYDYSSVQCDFPKDISEEIYQWGKKHIPDSMLDPNENNARQPVDDIHTTIKYGLYIVDPTEVKGYFYDQKPFKITLGPISIFENDTSDVIKIDLISDDLMKLNKLISDNFKTHDSFPVYHPHSTLAYVQKGTGSRFVGMDAFEGREIIMKSVMFSGKDNRKTEIPLRKK